MGGRPAVGLAGTVALGISRPLAMLVFSILVRGTTIKHLVPKEP